MMTSKERKKLKHSLKTEIDKADTYITLANIGEVEEVNSSKNKDETAESRAFVVQKLQEAKERLRQGLENYEKAIDEAIASMS